MKRLLCSDFDRTTSRKRPEERLFNISDQHQSRIYPPSAIRCSTNAKWSFFSFANSCLVHANFAKTSAMSAITAVLGSIMLPVDPKNSYYRSDDPLSSHPPVESHPHFYSSFFNYTPHFPGTFPSTSSWYLFGRSVRAFLPFFLFFSSFLWCRSRAGIGRKSDQARNRKLLRPCAREDIGNMEIASTSTEDSFDFFLKNVTSAAVNSTSRKCGPFPNDPDRCVLLSHLRRSAACFSLAGCTFVVVLIWLVGQWRQCPAQRMIFFLIGSCIVQSLGGILSDPDTDSNTPLCQAQAFLQQLGNWLVMLWVMCIALNVSCNVLGSRKSAQTVSFEKICLAFVSTLSLTMALIPLESGAFGHTGGWCWITSKFTTMRFATLYVPMYIILAIIVIVYVLMARKLRRKSRQFAKNAARQAQSRGSKTRAMAACKRRKREGTKAARGLLAYPLIFLLLAAFPLINRVYQAHKGEGEALLFLAAIHAVSMPFLGLANALVYGLNKQTIRALRHEVSCKKARENSRSTTASTSESMHQRGRTVQSCSKVFADC